MVNGKSQSQLNHPAIEATLLIKWNSVRKWYLTNAVFYALFLAVLSSYFVVDSDPDYRDPWNILKLIYTSFYLLFLAGRELLQIITLKWNYIQFENIIDWVIIISTSVFLIISLGPGNHEMAVNALAFAMLFGETIFMYIFINYLYLCNQAVKNRRF